MIHTFPFLMGHNYWNNSPYSSVRDNITKSNCSGRRKHSRLFLLLKSIGVNIQRGFMWIHGPDFFVFKSNYVFCVAVFLVMVAAKPQRTALS